MTFALDFPAAAFRETGQPYLSARRVAEKLGLPLSDLAILIGVARTTLTAKTGARKVDGALSPLVRIFAMATEMAGDDGRAAIWFKHQPIVGFGRTAEELVEDGHADAVMWTLESMEQGVYA